MAFATRSDLLARSNARRLAQLAVPADVQMPPDDALRVAIAGGDLSALTSEEHASVTLALSAIDGALVDAAEVLVSYRIPTTASSPLIARLCSTIALYYLQGAERMTDEVKVAYEASIGMLRSHARGDLNLLPVTVAEAALPEDQVILSSSPRRYGSTVPVGGW
ncbi:phage protein Gp36 family protein [Ferriphaselus sp. R-1]|uniref:phage protein Gp36 family protein n=1 Tax=Ferriphaselus sp. R-1 TaxID=1485544 RepID=UPI00054F7C01|nr:phage protein Gp36 family protein [Ferriphaselus sp. R-1]